MEKFYERHIICSLVPCQLRFEFSLGELFHLFSSFCNILLLIMKYYFLFFVKKNER